MTFVVAGNILGNEYEGAANKEESLFVVSNCRVDYRGK